MKHTVGFATLFIVIIAAAGFATAGVTPAVQKAFAGTVVITHGPFPEDGTSDDAIIAKAKKATLTELTHQSETDGSAEWEFSYTAFFKKPLQVTEVSIDFYTTDKDELFVASKRLVGIAPGLPILAGMMKISEDDGLVRGRLYRIKVTGKVKRRERVFAETTLKML